MYKHILIPTDGSDLSLKGVEHGVRLAKENASQVSVIKVSQPYPLQSAATLDSWSTAQKAHAQDALAKAKAIAEKHGVDITTRQDTNDSAADAILESAQSLECDLIVMASHGRRGISRLLLGSQTSEVVSHSPIPVLVVR
ncbi:universal stress protein [Roseovarius sp. M141]|uniref:universal stress protein n=1 Tax=Roseovarius sp. M141 TaxID=2583806 RepID=UPI0020CD5737|nr:universal stress protein [Roseovarius sp. M141]MCQ0091705.1 universal stress protein [Roseovarius sp. M141]